MKTTDPRHALGRRGEDLAADFFIRKGFTIVARNWKCRQGELDLIIRSGDEIRVVEVKTRVGQTAQAGPQETVNERKLARMGEAAARFFYAHPELPDQPHFDVFTVKFSAADVPAYQWLKDFE